MICFRSHRSSAGLRGELQNVAAVSECRSLIRQDHRHPGATGEAGEPGKSFRRRRHVLAQMLVSTGDDESIQSVPPQLMAQCRETLSGYISHIEASSKATTYFHNSLKTHAPAAWLVGYWQSYTRHNLCYGALKGGRRPLILMPRRTQPLPLEMTAMSAPTANDQFGLSLGDPPISIQRTDNRQPTVRYWPVKGRFGNGFRPGLRRARIEPRCLLTELELSVS